MAKVVVVGSINSDLVLSVPHFVAPGETLSATAFRVFGGGKGANQAVAARRFGARVELVGALGTDPESVQRRAELEREEVALNGLSISDGAGGMAVIQVTQEGQNSIVIVPGANGTVSPTQVEPALDRTLEPGDVVCCQLEIPFPATATALRRARLHGAITLLNAAPASREALALLSLCDVLVVNEIEAGQLLDQAPATTENAGALARRLAELGAGQVVITLGERGVVLFSDGRVEHLAAIPVNAVDTTGAGDVFVGVLAASLAEGVALHDGVERGIVASGLAVTRPGARASFPTRAEIDAWSANRHT